MKIGVTIYLGDLIKMLKFYVKAQTALQALKDEHGQGMIEYVLLGTLISIVAILTITNVGTNVNTKFNSLASTLS
jgi:Flp pilus assembly pilin Flp